ncbi:MAG: AraC family transcriptional regulator [Suipraeoptans sp.]
MHKELIEQLAIITDEEKEILAGKKNINKDIYTQKKDLVVDSNKLLERGKLIQVRTHTRFVHFPKHRHNYIEVIYMCKGETKHIINGNEVVLKEGDLLFLNQNAVQEIYPAGEGDIAVNFIILPEFFNVTFDMMKEEKNNLRDFLVESLGKGSFSTSYLYFKVAEVLPIQNLIENMVWTIINDQPNKRSINQTTMGLTILQLLNHMDKMDSGGNSYENEITFTILNYIETNFKTGTLQELADLLGRDIYWLSKEVKKRTGKTYKELLLTKRMSQAAYLLLSSKMPISDIIESVGYENTSYFFRKFREKYDVSPKEYRESKKSL